MSTNFLRSCELGLTSLAHGHAELTRILRFVGSPIAAIVRWMRIRRTYHELLDLDPRTLRDIGLERDSIEVVARNAVDYPSVDPRRFNQ